MGVTKKGEHINRTHCKRGHQLTPDNIHLNESGYRLCKTCWRERNRKHQRDFKAKHADRYITLKSALLRIDGINKDPQISAIIREVLDKRRDR